MPYFAWKGVNLKAQLCKGIQFARNEQELDLFLLKKDVALLSSSTKKIWWNPAISLQTKIDYFMQLAVLVKAGMLLPEALNLVANQSHNRTLTGIAYDIADNVGHGISFSNALAKNKSVFNNLMIQMIAVGQESGSLGVSLDVLTHHLEALALFKARLRAALVLPIITFCFFMTIIAIMLIVVVPQFALLFKSMHRDLPAATKIMVALGDFLRSWYSLVAIVLLMVPWLVFVRFMKTDHGKLMVDRFLMRLPLINAIIINKTMAGFFKAIGLLIQGGMPLVKAIHIARESIDNTIIKNDIEYLEQEVNAGGSFAESLAGYEYICGQEVVALIKIGQESGALNAMLNRVSQIYEQRLILMLGRINTLFQPFLLIILGLMITGLILALYTPIMNLSYAI